MSWWRRVPDAAPDGARGVAVAPSLLACDFARLGEEIAAVERAGADVLHLDVMDGHFVPNLTFGPLVVEAVRRLTKLPLDAHLMIAEPHRYVDRFVEAGADVVTVHVEASTDLERDLARIRELGARAGVAFNPDRGLDAVERVLDRIDLLLVMSVFPGFGGQAFIADVLDEVRAAARVRAERGLDFVIEIDGGIKPATAPAAREAGAEILVAGTAVFRSDDYARAIAEIRGE